jgi:hypothetical protein
LRSLQDRFMADSIERAYFSSISPQGIGQD